VYSNIKTKLTLTRFGSSLKARAVRGSLWLGAGSVAEQTTRFARNLILARILAPSAFGTMAIVLSVTSLLTAFTEVGVREALIQNPRGRERRYVEAAWWMAFGRALATYCALFLAAPWVARFYGNLELSLLLRVALVGLLLEGAISARAYAALKDMRFSKWAAILNGGGITGIVITVILSFLIRDVWALVLGSCAESAARCLLSYAICPFFPSLTLNREAFKDLLSFSRKLFGMSALYLVFLRADIFVLAKMYSSTQLGLYTMAVFLVQVPCGFLIGLMSQVLMPTLAEIQSDKERMNRIVLHLTTLIGFLGMPVLVFLFFYGRPLLTLVYGQAYAADAFSLAVAGAIALISLINVQLTTLFYASGHPNLHRRCVAVMALTTVLLIFPSAKWLGPVGGQVSALIAMTVGFLLQAERAYRVTGFKVTRYITILLRSAALSIPVMTVWLLTRLLLPATGMVASLGFGLLGCFSGYAVAAWLLLWRQGSADDQPAVRSYFHGVMSENADV